MSDYVKVGLETGDYGSGTATTTGVKVTVSSNEEDRGVTFEETIDSIIKNDGHAGALKASGSLEGLIRPQQLRNIFYGFLGTETAGVGSKDYTFSQAPKPLVLEVGDITAAVGGSERVFTGVGVKSINLAMEAKEYVKATMEWVAKSYSDTTYEVPTYTTESPVVFWRAQVSIGGKTTVPIKSMNLNMDGKINDDEFVLGDFELFRLVRNGIVEVTGDMTLSEVEYEEINRAIYGATDGTSVSSLNPLGYAEVIIVLSTIAGDTAMTITLPKIIYSKGSNSRSGRDSVEKKIDFEAVGGITITIPDAA